MYTCNANKRYGMELGKPTFVPVKDLEMGFEKIVKIAHVSGGKLFLCNSIEGLKEQCHSNVLTIHLQYANNRISFPG